MNMPTLAVADVMAVTLDILGKMGTPAAYAEIVGNSLVGANLVGHDSHGVMRLPSYVKMMHAGLIVPTGSPRVVRRAGATAHIDGQWGWGPVGAHLATETAIDLAKAHGIAAVTLNRCAHIGRLGEYVALMAEAGMAGLALCNAGSAVAPFGGRERILGTNPIALAAPTGPDDAPVVVDFATSGVAEGKLRVARAKGETVAPGLIVDRYGHASQVPDDFYAGGALLPFGGHKGYGLGLMVELLGGILSTAGPSGMPDALDANGTLLLAMNISHFLPRDDFVAQAAAYTQRISNSTPAAGFERVLLPGEPERMSLAYRTEHGIPIPDTTWDELQELQRTLSHTTGGANP